MQEASKNAAAVVGPLPALPPVAAQVLRLIGEPKTTAKALEEVISGEPALTAKVLRIAHFAFFGARGNVETLGRAIAVLGFNTLRSVVLTGVAEGVYTNSRSCLEDPSLWEHALAVALAAKILTQECGYPDVEEAYVAGLLHDIGKPVMDANEPDRYDQVLERVYHDRRTFLAAEREVFAFDHADVGGQVAERWGLAPRLCEAVLRHHDPTAAVGDPGLCAVVSLANRMCVKLGIGPERAPELSLADPDSPLTLSWDRLDAVADSVQEKLAEEKLRISTV